MSERSLILFDGVCNLCNGFVNFLIDRDQADKFVFGSLQSDHVKKLLKEHNLTSDTVSSVLLLEENKLYSKSTAVLRIFKKLRGAWPLLYGFIIIPVPVRDVLYNLVAKNRYWLFGRRETCRLPTPELRSKFVE